MRMKGKKNRKKGREDKRTEGKRRQDNEKKGR